MFKYIMKRLCMLIPVLIGISTIVFLLISLIPGDVVDILLGTSATPEAREALRENLGLNKPVVIRYFEWMFNAIQLDFGESIRTGKPVIEEFFARLPATLQLAGLAMAISLLIGIPFGILAAIKKDSWISHVVSVVSMLGVSIPAFWLGTMLILFISLQLRLLPPGGFVPFLENPIENLKGMILPAFTLGTSMSAVVMRMTRSAMLEVLGQDYMKTALAKGVTPKLYRYKHAFKNALIPVLTVIGIQIGYLLGGAVIIEEVFALPGVGRLALQAIYQRDYPLVQVTVLMFSLGFVLVNLLVDIIYAYIDPRIRYE
ncbi:ABC transporter permease [Paenisporosarcina sp. TG20]|uniref:ABC transporter permease n=1 Tax=Paenisporosarcina sp. TG20 TaxID=1211706 RepID=UPI0002E334B5|nr:ABC transporter permease [Paenisporosarcina sp. TG20]